MKEIFERIAQINDPRQAHKTKHKLIDVVVIVLFSMLAGAEIWEDIQMFAVSNEGLLRKYIELPNGIPSHDTMQRVMSLIEPETMRKIQTLWNEMLMRGDGEKLKKIINIDGKTMRSSAVLDNHPLHVVSAWSKEDGVCFGQTAVKEKENEITAIPKLVNTLNIRGQVITIDAMGTQTKIADQIVEQKGHYVLAVKGNQTDLCDDIRMYFEDEEFRTASAYKRTVEKARSQIEKREYYQTDNIEWLPNKKRWKGLRSIGMTVNTMRKGEETTVEKRYYISSLSTDVELFCKAVRGHWAIESMHWQLDVTFREDYNKTLDRNAALNLNILRKMCLPILKMLNIGMKASLRSKRKAIGWNTAKYIEQIMNF
ncbi:putative transposase - IS1548 [Clostridia bacterium]|nr:putative transposase - IS1548 [Clostridia bacterium]